MYKMRTLVSIGYYWLPLARLLCKKKSDKHWPVCKQNWKRAACRNWVLAMSEGIQKLKKMLLSFSFFSELPSLSNLPKWPTQRERHSHYTFSRPFRKHGVVPLATSSRQIYKKGDIVAIKGRDTFQKGMSANITMAKLEEPKVSASMLLALL